MRKMIAKVKLSILSKVLTSCGVPNTLYNDEENGILSVRADLWNCVDGSSVEVCAYAMIDDNYELEAYAEPEGDREASMAKIAAL